MADATIDNSRVIQTFWRDPDVKLQRVEFVGPQVGKELATDGLLALLFVVFQAVFSWAAPLQDGLDAAFAWMDAELIPLFRKQMAKKG